MPSHSNSSKTVQYGSTNSSRDTPTEYTNNPGSTNNENSQADTNYNQVYESTTIAEELSTSAAEHNRNPTRSTSTAQSHRQISPSYGPHDSAAYFPPPQQCGNEVYVREISLDDDAFSNSNTQPTRDGRRYATNTPQASNRNSVQTYTESPDQVNTQTNGVYSHTTQRWSQEICPEELIRLRFARQSGPNERL